MPRLGDWNAQTDASRIHLHPDLSFLNFKSNNIDIAICCGIPPWKKLEGLSFHDPALAMQAAADGLGLAIGYRELIDRDLQNSNLVIALHQAIKHPFSYYLVYSVQNKNKPLQAFIKWLKSA